MTRDQIEAKLTQAFPESEILVQDLTGTQNHFEVRILSTAFQGLSRLEQHQTVYRIFDNELKSGELHALKLMTFAK